MQITNRQLFKMSQSYDEFLELSFDASTESQIVHCLAQLDTAINAVTRKLASVKKKLNEELKELGEPPDQVKAKELTAKYNQEFEDFLDESVDVQIKPIKAPKGEIKGRLLVTFNPIFEI